MNRYVSRSRSLQLEQQVDDLRLHGHVERRDGFVRDDERGVQGEGAREPDALPLAAAELVRVAARERRVETDERQQLGDPGAPVRLRADAVDVERLLTMLSDAHPRVRATQYGS